MVSWPVAGIQTHFQNVSRVVRSAPELTSTHVEVVPWRDGGAIERLSLLPQRLRSTIRTVTSTLPLYGLRDVDVVWAQTLFPIAPYLFTQAAVRHIPVVYDIDCTPRLLASFGPHYARQVAGPSLKRRAVDTVLRASARRCAAIVCWSQWAAHSFATDYGVDPQRLHVIAPGVDTTWWEPPLQRVIDHDRVRLLFVGGDFIRKGGDLLLDVWQQHFHESCELHLVTRDAVSSMPGVRTYSSFTPNDPGLRDLYHSCDALVLPTRADCFSLASIEAMAAGLPVITTTVGGIPEIIADRRTGYLIPPDDGSALRHALEVLVETTSLRAWMGAEGRAVATAHFDATQQAQRLLALLARVARPHPDSSSAVRPAVA
jgi:glycosyltransferase involved in cell wall biosynthesis